MLFQYNNVVKTPFMAIWVMVYYCFVLTTLLQKRYEKCWAIAILFGAVALNPAVPLLQPRTRCATKAWAARWPRPSPASGAKWAKLSNIFMGYFLEY
jgi:hypothetical protein